MEYSKINKIIVSNAVRKGIRDIAKDSKRALRSLVDMGAHFSKSRGPTEFFRAAQKLLDDPKSSYYKLVTNLVASVNHKTLESVGMNVGYMSWTYGAHQIRQYENANGYNVPWTVFLNCDSNSNADIEEIISQGQTMGIYSYMFLAGNILYNLPELLSIFRSHSDCAFILFSDSDMLSVFLSLSDSPMENVLISLEFPQKDIKENVKALCDRKRFWGMHYIYNDENAQEIISGSLLQQCLEEKSNIIFLITGSQCSPGTIAAVNEYVDKVRKSKAYPIFISNLFSDVKYVDTVISSEPFTKVLLADDTIILKEKTISDIGRKQTSLADIFKDSK